MSPSPLRDAPTQVPRASVDAVRFRGHDPSCWLWVEMGFSSGPHYSLVLGTYIISLCLGFLLCEMEINLPRGCGAESME